MPSEQQPGRPEILGRLRVDAHEQLDAPAAPRLARPIGWIIVVALVVAIVLIAITANPL